MKKAVHITLSVSIVLSILLCVQLYLGYVEADLEGIETNLTNDTMDQGKPAIFGNRVVWTEDTQDGGPNWDIFLYDLDNGAEKIRITYNASNQLNPEIYGDVIVWEDERHGNFDIYMYDLSVDTDGDDIPNYLDGDRPSPDPAEIRITDNPAHQENPVIYSSKMVWIDKRYGNNDVFLYDLISGEEAIIAGHSETGDPRFRPKQDYPRIYGDKVVWVDNRDSIGNYELYIYNLSMDSDGNGIPNYLDGNRPIDDPAEQRITSTPDSEYCPFIYSDQIVYTRNDNVYLYDLTTSAEYQLTETAPSQEIDGELCGFYGTKVVWTYYNGSKDIFLYDLALDSDTDGTPNYRDIDTPIPDPAINQVTFEQETLSMRPAIYTNKIVWHDSRDSEREVYLFTLTENLPPEITYFLPSNSSEIGDEDSLMLNLTALDPESDVLTYTWFIDEEPQVDEIADTFEFEGDPNLGGWHDIKVIVFDGEYSVEKIWQINVIESNVMSPEIIEISPVFNPSYTEGGEMTLSITAKDEDSDTLGVAWYEDGGLIHTQIHNLTTSNEVFDEWTFSSSLDDSGSDYTISYTITVNVTDGKFITSHTWMVTVLYFEDADMDGYNDSTEVTWSSDPLNSTSTPTDLDGDFIVDALDDDKDGDGVLDKDDAYPLDPERSSEGNPDYMLEILVVIISIIILIVALVTLPRIIKRKKMD